MAACRILFALLIALAVAVAPVSAALTSGHAAAKTDMASQAEKQDCHGMAPAHSTDGDMNTKCPGDGSKCCKLTGALLFRPLTIVAVPLAHRGTEPQEPAGWSVKPRLPPPRS